VDDHNFPKSRRLLKKVDFDRVFLRRRSRSDHLLVIYACENGLPHCRLGLVVSRRYGGAPHRNRWKRCLREAFRRAQHDLPAGLDVVALPRAPRQSPTTVAVEQSLRNLAARLAADLPDRIASTEPPAPSPQ
jgi:ribonuclease P protein component